MKIFLVEDDTNLNETIVRIFSELNYDVTTFKDGKEAFENLEDKYDLYLIDINLPNVNGMELVKQIKFLNKNANIFVVSADINIETIVKAYDLGCIDYIKKPFDIREIISKIKHTLNVVPNNIKFEDCGEYNSKERLFIKSSETIKLTNKEALLLDILIKYSGQIVSNEQIEAYVWCEPFKNGHVRQLVSKLKHKIKCDLIENHSSNGYKLSVKIYQ